MSRTFVARPGTSPEIGHPTTPAPANCRGGTGRDGNPSPKEQRTPMDVTAYLDQELRNHTRVRDLEAMANQAADRPLDDFLTDLRAVLKDRPISGGDHQRLHVLLSQLYHASAAVDRTLLDGLRSEVTSAWELGRSRAHLADRKE